MEEKLLNFYEILGVERTADAKEIKQAYRNLAKEWHPDVNDSPDADKRFEEIGEAYNILSDDNLRKEYDIFLEREAKSKFRKVDFEYQDIFDMFFNKKRGSVVPINGDHIEKTVRVTVQNILQEAEMSIQVVKKRLCMDCNGKGLKVTDMKCIVCGGEGSSKTQKITPFGKIETRVSCTHCHGTGREKAIPCKTCKESGVLPDDVKHEFELPVTLNFGQTLLFRSKGMPGRNGGDNGDLKITILQDEFDTAKVEYDVDVVEKRKIPLEDVLKGDPIEIIFPDGTSEIVPLPSEVKTGHRMVFNGKGLYKNSDTRGQYYVDFLVDVPSLSHKQKQTILKVLSEGVEE